ncbi:MAG: amidohydrolase, partial [Myxococcota bacterium]
TSPPALSAELVLSGGDIVTVDPTDARVSAMAVRGGEIVWLGEAPVPPEWIGPDTVVVDLAGAQVLPGLHDVHNHILEAFQPAAGTCIVTGYAPLRSHVDELRDCADDQVGTQWVVGWGFDFWTATLGGDLPKEVLDVAIPDRPAVILEATSHAAWVNSAALAALGFDENTADPVGGVIVRSGGVPNGLLLDAAGERAMDLALADAPAMRPLNEEALRLGLQEAARNGITAVGDGRGYWKRGYVEAWKAVQASGDLTLRAVVPLWAYPDADDDEQIAALAARFDSAPDARLRFDQVKVYSDGIVWLTTGALLDPYVGPTFAGETGLTYFDQPRLTRYVTELERVGFDFHVHAIGDRGVHQALNAIEASRAVNGELGARHRLTHLEWVAPADVERFAPLGVAADFQLAGAWTRPQNLHDNDFLVGAERVDERAYRVRDLYDAGARVVLSSDYDVGPMSPFASMNAALTRGDQSLPSVDAALRAMTIDAAYVLGHEHLVGSLEVGKRADFVVVDRDVYTTTDLAATRVWWTVVDGVEVFRDASFTAR